MTTMTPTTLMKTAWETSMTNDSALTPNSSKVADKRGFAASFLKRNVLVTNEAMNSANTMKDSSILIVFPTNASAFNATSINESSSHNATAYNEPAIFTCPTNLCFFVAPAFGLLGCLLGIPICKSCILLTFACYDCVFCIPKERSKFQNNNQGTLLHGLCMRIRGGKRKDLCYAYIFYGCIWALITTGLSVGLCGHLCGF